MHEFTRTQVIPASLDECWRFFCAPENLVRLTPPKLALRPADAWPKELRAGLTIDLSVRPMLGIPLRWRTEITRVEPPHCFVDEQRAGPYREWHHEHHFRALNDTCTEMRDVVHYALPFGWLGDLANPWLVAPQLRRIFDFRAQAVREIFGARYT
jgi:ligand-binding SRPBCC domain-containing protein